MIFFELWEERENTAAVWIKTPSWIAEDRRSSGLFFTADYAAVHESAFDP